MSIEKFEHDCGGCRPAIIDPNTGETIPDDDPVMIAIMEVWGTLSDIEKATFHRVTCLNSREPEDLEVMQSIIAAFGKVSDSGKNTGKADEGKGKRVRVHNGDGTKLIGDGVYVGVVSLWYFRSRSNKTLRTVSHPETKPDDATIKAMEEDGFYLLEDPENPKIVLDTGVVVYGCQVWWDFI